MNGQRLALWVVWGVLVEVCIDVLFAALFRHSTTEAVAIIRHDIGLFVLGLIAGGVVGALIGYRHEGR